MKPPSGVITIRPVSMPCSASSWRRASTAWQIVRVSANDEIAYHLQIPLFTVTWVFRVLVLTGPVLAFALTRMICHAVEARRRDEATRGIETGRIVMTPEGGFSEIRSVPKAKSLTGAQ